MTDLVGRLRLVPFLRPLSLHAKEVVALVSEAAAEIERLQQGGAAGIEHAAAPTVDWQRQAIIRDGAPVHLSTSEWLIFTRLVKNTGKLVTKEELFDEIYWADPNGGAEPKIIGVFVCTLRKKCPWPITTVWGRGYIIEGCHYIRPAPPSPRAVAGVTRERLMAGR